VSSPLRRLRPPAAYGVSLALHGLLFAGLLGVHPPREQRATPVDIDLVETPPPRALPPEAPPPAQPPAAVPVRRPPRVAHTLRPPPLPADAPPPAASEAPPPPNETPPAAAPKSAPVRIGVSMSSTTTAGGFAAPVGNSLYGRAPAKAEDPATAQPYRGDRYAPPTQVTSLPEPLGCEIPKSEYPEEARRLGLEGEVRLRLVVDEEGRVQDVKVLRDPGHGFGAVAARSARAYCRFRPARKDGQAVATEIAYTIRFEL
jgi:periplasmic protein TonB